LAPVMRAARAAAKRVSVLAAPDIGDNYFALSQLVPPQRWAQRETYLRKGLDIEPDAPEVGNALAELLVAVGRWRDAELVASGVAGRDPFNPLKVMNHYAILRLLGDQAEAAELKKMSDRYWPGDSSFAARRFMSSDFRGKAAEPASLMADPVIATILGPGEAQTYINQMLRALSSRQPADIDVAVKDCLRGWVSYQVTVVCLVGMSVLGRMDDAFLYGSGMFPDTRAATSALEDEQWLRRGKPSFDTFILYRAELAPMRADPRFIELAERTGLLDYWRGHSPDFCEKERVPVCEALRKAPGK